MNPATRIWDIPPPPGTEEEFDIDTSNEKSSTDMPEEKAEENSPLRAIDRIDPYLKNPEYVDYEKRHRKKSRSRTRSKSKDRHRRRRYSRSRSRSRHRRSRSKSRRHRRRYSSSHSRSRSPSHRHSRHKRSRRRHSPSRHSRSRSRSISKSHHRRRRTRSPKDKASSTAVKHESEEQPLPDVDVNEVDMKIEEEEEEDDVKDNVFKNDGSFLEMFKKMQEQQQQKVTEEPVSSLDQIKKPVLPVFGKRRGGKVLKTGMVQKLRQPSEEENNAQDAWSIYMKEVRRYKEAHCDDDSKTRPLVK